MCDEIKTLGVKYLKISFLIVLGKVRMLKSFDQLNDLYYVTLISIKKKNFLGGNHSAVDDKKGKDQIEQHTQWESLFFQDIIIVI